MAELIDIRRVEIGPENMTAYVRIADEAPLMTSEDLEGTARVYRILPHIVEHACLGDAGETFRDAMGDTEIAHLLEHVTVELLAQTDIAGDMPAGRTWVDEVDDRTFAIELACPDDVLVAATLSTGAWILNWAYTGGGEPEPDVAAIVGGLVSLVESVEGQGEDLVIDEMPEFDEPEPEDEDEGSYAEDDEYEGDEHEADEADEDVADEPAAEGAAPEPESAPKAPAPEPAPLWTPAPVVDEPTREWHRTTDLSETEVEAEIDQIMATIEMSPLVVDDPKPTPDGQ